MPRATPAERATVIYEATHRLILRGGVGAATTRAIAEEAGLTHSAVRHRFSPQAWLLACAWWRIAEVLDGRTTEARYALGRALRRDADRDVVRALAADLVLAMLPTSEASDELDLWRLLLAYEEHARHDGLSGDQLERWHGERRALCRHALEAMGVSRDESAMPGHLTHALVSGLLSSLVGWRRPVAEEMPDGIVPPVTLERTPTLAQAREAVRAHLDGVDGSG